MFVMRSRDEADGERRIIGSGRRDDDEVDGAGLRGSDTLDDDGCWSLLPG